MSKIADNYKTSKRVFEDYLAKALVYANHQNPEFRYKAKKYLSFASNVFSSLRLDLEEIREDNRYNKLVSKLEQKLKKMDIKIKKILGGMKVR